MISSIEGKYDLGIVEKVNRLLDLLSEIDRHQILSKKTCLFGGTAINLFMLDAPRLSIDADISYIGNGEKSIENLDRTTIERALQDVGFFLGYNVTAAKETTAGRTFRLRYSGSRGADLIKIDINYLNRIPLHPINYSECILDNRIKIRTLSQTELIAGKVKALFDRVVVRDLYDISHIYQVIANLFYLSDDENKRKLRRTIIFYTALSNLFPRDFEGITEKRFSGRNKQVRDELYPFLGIDDRPTLKEMIINAEAFISEYAMPKDEAEKDYFIRFSKAEYRPELLFSEWPEVLAAAERSPSAKWKILNLKQRPA